MQKPLAKHYMHVVKKHITELDLEGSGNPGRDLHRLGICWCR